MITSNDFEEFGKWHKKNRYIFHWRVSAGVVKIISVYAPMDDPKDAQRLARALRYRGVSARSGYRNVSVGNCDLGIFLQALKAIKVDWEDFKETVSYIYFDGEKHVTDQRVES